MESSRKTTMARARFFIAAILLGMASGAAGQPSANPALDLSGAPAFIHGALKSNICTPAVLNTSAYKAIQREVEALAGKAGDLEEFIAGFNQLWREGPVSHVRLDKTRQPAAQIAAYLDTMNVGGGGARLAWREDVAVLTVNTMMGQDTIGQIEAAYKELQTRKVRALIIDLRDNEGGTFAVRPLVGHLLDSPLEAGCFVSQAWTTRHPEAPSAKQLQDIAPWRGWSLQSFWGDVLEKGVLRVVFEPLAPRHKGNTYLLTSQKTASAAELAASAIQLSGRAVIVGEKTAGKMLSQKMFDLPLNLQLSLPIADYYAAKHGRIEGVGISPDIAIEAGKAMDKALELARAMPE